VPPTPTAATGALTTTPPSLFCPPPQEDEAEDAPIPEPDRGTIKANLVNLMSAVPPLVQRQVRAAGAGGGSSGSNQRGVPPAVPAQPHTPPG
jgi:hypothetical protein